MKSFKLFFSISAIDQSLKVCELWQSSFSLPLPSFSLWSIKSYCESVNKGFEFFLNTFDPLTDLTCKYFKDICVNCSDSVVISSNATAITGVNGTATSG
ncbi:uncharacterized protein LOC116655181 isoform X2 [Drosophila ananassae]|uniref:uncharacterized protein LOC116655181 isoform X2 n=1 Tax=Drosophila ananassae TaxID=7217 RepID=UPI0013A5C15C|nr:uncharacterized protein LOC116655181 isoform X2 [Drosophila ananassae]